MDIPFAPGAPPLRPGPLARYLPPLQVGSVSRLLDDFGAKGELLLDPFGASPVLALEAAKAGRAVIVAVNNPVTRFVLRHTLQPFTHSELQTALARLATSAKDGGRLEGFLLDLYRSQCSRCGASVSADYFVWDRGALEPSHKAYTCPRCNHTCEEPTGEADRQLARTHSTKGLQHSLALESVAPRGDPDRPQARLALAVYPARAIFGLVSMINKLPQLGFEPRLEAAAQALLLSAFDATNMLWGHREARARPRQLSVPSTYREINVWRAMEAAAQDWTLDDPGIPVSDWTGTALPEPGAVAIYAGQARELAPTLPPGSVRSVATVLPRPNQAYWTLGALWAAWLWGRRAAAPIKAALRRRRYDWAWHAGALRAVLGHSTAILQKGTPAIVVLAESEPSFISASLVALDMAGFRLAGRALRQDAGQAVFTCLLEGAVVASVDPSEVKRRLIESMAAALGERGEPAPYAVLHAAALCELARQGHLAPMWQLTGGPPIASLASETGSILTAGGRFCRLDEHVEVESGQYWLNEPPKQLAPLSDRVEERVLHLLRQESPLPEEEVDRSVCRSLPGLTTPDARLVRACLASYADFDSDHGLWNLRDGESALARETDCDEIRRSLIDLGKRLGFSVKQEEDVEWKGRGGKVAYSFHVQATAAVGEGLTWSGTTPHVLVVPGGRAALIAEKSRRNLLLKAWLAEGTRVVKFRHVRRLAADQTLERDNLSERLALDPPLQEEAQMPLL